MVHVGCFILSLTNERMARRKCFDAVAVYEVLCAGGSTLVHISMVTHTYLHLAVCNQVGHVRVVSIMEFTRAGHTGQDFSRRCRVLTKGVGARHRSTIKREPAFQSLNRGRFLQWLRWSREVEVEGRGFETANRNGLLYD